MANVTLNHISKIYPGSFNLFKKKSDEQQRSGDVLAVDDFNMEIQNGEFIVFVGPSGCGKSTTLRMIAGLEEITMGELYIDDVMVNTVVPKDRDIAMVFQNYALYPHMTAYNNMAFGLKLRKVLVEKKDKDGNPVIGIDKRKIKEITKKIKNADKHLSAPEIEEDAKARVSAYKEKLVKELEYYQATPVPLTVYKHLTKEEIDKKVRKAAKILGVEELLESKPKEMSGGQKQRIALGRAIVREPKVMLLDEPLSNLDAKLRTSMRAEIVKLHEELQTTFIYVTHDQIEAMTMGTRIVVMKLGVVQQIDTPTNLFDYPENKFVAGFIGTPQMNFFDVKIRKSGETLVVTFADGQVQSYPLNRMRKIDEAYMDGADHEATLGIRGENIKLDENGLETTLTIKEILGNVTQMFVRLVPTDRDCVVCLSERNDLEADDKVKIGFDPRKIHLFDKTSEKTIMSREQY